MPKKVRLGPQDDPAAKPSGSAPPPAMADLPLAEKAGIPDKDKKGGGGPKREKLKAPVRVADAPPVVHRAKPKKDPKKLVTKKGVKSGEKKPDKPDRVKLKKGAPRTAPRPAIKSIDEVAEEGLASDEPEKKARRPVEVEKEEEKDEDEGEKDGATVELEKAEAPAKGAEGDVPGGKDPDADEEGFIPLTEALRRSGGGGKQNIVPNWISSNMSQDGDIGLAEYRQMLLGMIAKNKVFPRNWDPNGFVGAAQVAGTVDGFTGRLLSVWLVQSSGRRDIDRAALATIVKCSPFPPIGTMGVLRFQIAIRYGPEQTASADE